MGVRQVAGALKPDGLIDYTRGEIQILDRARLERRSCECYATTAHYRELIEARNLELNEARQHAASNDR